jgi:hypothetical protein
MADESVIVAGTGTIFLGGPPLVRAATGEEISAEELGGGDAHARRSGVVDHLAVSDRHALAVLREAVDRLPPDAPAPWEVRDPVDPVEDPADLLGIVPPEPRRPYDPREVIARLVDGSELHEFKPLHGETLVCGFAHLHGHPVAILASNGVLFSESARKGAHFVQLACRPWDAAPVPAERHGVHGRQGRRARRHRAGRREAGDGRGLRGRAEAHGPHGRLLRRGQLRARRTRLRSPASCSRGLRRGSP